MDKLPKQLNDIIRKVDSDFYDQKVYGEGFIVTWHNKKKEVVSDSNLLSKMFSKKHYEYYFVRSHSKPLSVKKVPFDWQEGTSDISLDFEASFEILISDKSEAEQLVRLLSQISSADQGLRNLIDKHLHFCMTQIYDSCVKNGSNLLAQFYQSGLENGESEELNNQVTALMRQELTGANFRIGFTLANAPAQYSEFKRKTPIGDSGLNVNSECRLTLDNYQAYQKSGITDIQGIIKHMESGIDQAIRQHILGKSLLELLSYFKTSQGDKPSISEQVKQSVQQRAKAIGYQLQSFHTLPDIPALALLTGLAVDFGEEDGAFKAGPFGGKVKLNIRMSVCAIEGEFEKQKHLLTFQSNNTNKQLNDITHKNIIDRIKPAIHTICTEEMRKHNPLDAVTRFEEVIKPGLSEKIIEIMAEQYGLDVTIKVIESLESEDAVRLEELRSNKNKFTFKFNAKSDGEHTASLTFSSSFEVTSLDLQSVNSWDNFERHDYGFRSGSPKRHESELDPSDDRGWKTLAIKRELESIQEDIVHYFVTSNAFIVDLRNWVFDIQHNHKFQDALITGAENKILKERGLVVKISRLAINDEDLEKAQLAFRSNTFKHIGASQEADNKKELEMLESQLAKNQAVSQAVTKKTLEFIKDSEDIESVDDLKELDNELVETVKKTVKSKQPSKMAELASKSTRSAKSDLDFIASALPKPEES
ncbi:hypothetical protein ACD631_16310 [Alteromonas macleodii]|uniref:hypothetical protein n=1 Tax=Alteromonas macleodii TaxID=28108 RepID=UPI0020768814|nr:hypothetical protein [Alteromonas macleodii]USI27919.1 hypothetical protein NFG60_19790 [Alteromonas macleodii]